MTYKKESFDEFLGNLHLQAEPMLLDDDIQEGYSRWLEEQGVDLIIAYAEKWHLMQLHSHVESNLK